MACLLVLSWVSISGVTVENRFEHPGCLLFDTSHDPSTSHAQAATDLSSHNQFDQHMGF
jgi:hypothetical protein